MASQGKRFTWTDGDESLCVHLGEQGISRVAPLMGVPDDNAKVTGYRVLENHLVSCNSLSQQVAHATTEKELVEVLGEPSEWEGWDSVHRWKRPDGEIWVVFRDGLAVFWDCEESGDWYSGICGSGRAYFDLDTFPMFRLERSKQLPEDVKLRTPDGKVTRR